MQPANTAATTRNELLDEAPASDVAVASIRPLPLGRGLLWTALATSGGILIVGLAVSELYYQTVRSELGRKQLRSENAILSDVRARETKQLGEYRWLKQSEGTLRIPLERARALVSAEYAAKNQKLDGKAATNSAVAAPDGNAR